MMRERFSGVKLSIFDVLAASVCRKHFISYSSLLDNRLLEINPMVVASIDLYDAALSMEVMGAET